MFCFFTKVKNIFLDILFPPICLNCQQPINDRNKLICEKCLFSIKLNNTLFCPVCLARLADNRQICHYNSQYLLAAAGDYNDPVLRNTIHYFKYKSFKNLAPILGKILINYLQKLQLINQSTNKLINYIVVPIPLHPKRERKRGFNQAELIAEIVAQNFNLELIEGLQRIKNNKPQAQCKRAEDRIEGVKGCFKIKNAEKIQGKNILLVDDVFTSGATINEAVKVLKPKGVKKIIALTIAKT
jgi:competence protein ComFC